MACVYYFLSLLYKEVNSCLRKYICKTSFISVLQRKLLKDE
ncbi:hypothetical protein GLE_3719 [Lysobacter enzymogenes]|uniref:Uncharacterized protein n=1 Tax=Lysobacter enzymogenes TaxID=69 RepID=A0A0S2DKJ0_LYSEN|nr:hypothetical protein GLE_3719 [Lysobacter enzymogenes]